VTRRALVVRGGWEGHAPVETTELFRPDLLDAGFEVTVAEDLEVYRDEALLSRTDLIVQCWTGGRLTPQQSLGLRRAVRAGTGLAGWHGGVCDSFRGSPDYLHLTGGQWAAHPGGFVEHDVHVLPERSDHELVAGLNRRWSLNTEQYWVLTDELNEVLVPVSLADDVRVPWHRPVTCPAVWTRRWGQGRIFVATPGHDTGVLADQNVRTIIERGILWASR